MRTVNRWNNSYSRASKNHFFSRPVVLLTIGLLLIFAWFKIFGGNNSTPTTPVEQSRDYIEINPTWTTSMVYIAQSPEREVPISSQQKLYLTDAYVLIDQWSATASLKTAKLDFDEKTQLSYAASDINAETLRLEKGRFWIDSWSESVFIELKRLTAKMGNGAIAMIEQTNTAFSVVYAIKGNIEIQTSIGQYTLPAGKGIKISDSNLSSTSTKLADLVDEIDASIAHNAVFIRNNWEEILKTEIASQKEIETTKNEKEQSNNLNISQESSHTLGKYIAFTQPVDGANVKTPTINITGTIVHPDVARVTINDIDTIVSPVNQTFALSDFKISAEINNIVYKVYDANGVRLDMGVLVVHAPKNISAQTTIIPQNFPISDKDFIITSPGKNPFATTDSYVRVQGRVPKWVVKYITVNDYRLQKFIPNSETWYYHANADIGTIKEWTNLYYIKFFDNNDKLLHTLLFTIIKDSKNANNINSTLFSS